MLESVSNDLMITLTKDVSMIKEVFGSDFKRSTFPVYKKKSNYLIEEISLLFLLLNVTVKL